LLQYAYKIGLKSPSVTAWSTSMLRILFLLVIVAAALAVMVPRLLSGSATPSVGSEAPNFTLPSQDGSSVSLKGYRGKWVVLYFYPKDQTPG
jgi:peroxiredoxin Q/BCP